MPIVYFISTIVAFLALVIYIVVSDKKVLFYNASFFIFVFLANLGYLFIGLSRNIEEALTANKMVYFAGVALSVFLVMLVCDACKIRLNKIVRLLLYSFNCLIVIMSMTMGFTDWFYKDCHIEKRGNVTVIVKSYGPAHALFVIMLYGYMILGISLIIYSIIKKKKIVYTNVVLMVSLYAQTVLMYTVGRLVLKGFEPICISYCLDDIILLFVTYNTSLYNLDEALLSSVEKQGNHGYLLFDRKFRLLSYNDVAIKFIPEIDFQKLAKPLDVTAHMAIEKIDRMIREYSGGTLKESITYDDKDVEISVQYMYKRNNVRGYMVRLTDDAKMQSYVRKLDLISKNKSNFLSNVSHEIRTPINAVLGMNEMILRESNDENIIEYANNIAESGRTLLQLINDVLDLSKIESGKFEVVPKEYRLVDVIHRLEDMTRPLIKDDKIEFVINVDESLPSVLFGDDIRVMQMVTNLLTNAVKYTENGTVTLTVSGRQKGDEFEFEYRVEDTGHGIKEEDIANLFNAFERVDTLKNSGIEGTGLGLAITQKFAVMMGGDIAVTSEYGKGSCFTITVAQKVVDSKPIGKYEDITRENVHKEYKELFHAPDAKVLVVDDVSANRLVVKMLLKKTQVQVMECASGKECIETVKNDRFDIILLDHMMPGLDGIETLEIIKKEKLCENTPVIALTANVSVDSKEKYEGYGFDGYLPKPIEPDALEELLRKYLL